MNIGAIVKGFLAGAALLGFGVDNLLKLIAAS